MQHLGSRLEPKLRTALAIVGLVAFSCLVAIFVGSGPSRAGAQDISGEDLFVANCSGCHQVGGVGVEGTFPPLAGNPAAADAAYVTATIQDGKSGAIEVLGVTYDGVMPPVTTLADDELAAVAEYVVGIAGGAAPSPTEPTEPTPSGSPAVAMGEDLFLGSTRLSGGGPACAACHTAGEVGNLGGGSLGPDLTAVLDRLGGETGVTGWLAAPASPTMSPIFTDKPLTPEEIGHLVAFLADAPAQNQPNEDADWLLIAAVVGIVILFGGMAVIWRGMRQTYRETLRSDR